MRILIFRPPQRRGELYFRVQQTQRCLEKEGHQVQVVARRGWQHYLRSLLCWPSWLRYAQIVFVYPHSLLSFYVLTAALLKRTVVIDHYVSFVRPGEVYGGGVWLEPFEKLAYRRATFVLTHTASIARELSQSWGIPSHQLHTVYSVVDTAHFAPRYHRLAEQFRDQFELEGRFVVFYHGLWHAWHGVEVLRAAVHQLVEAGEPVALVLLGRVGQGAAHERWLDEVPYQQLPAYIQMADVWCSGFANLQRGERSFSSTMIQALSMGRPVITSPSLEKVRYLQDNVSVIYVPPADPAALGQALRSCMYHPLRCREIGQAGRQVVLDNFDEQHLANFLRRVCQVSPEARHGNS